MQLECLNIRNCLTELTTSPSKFSISLAYLCASALALMSQNERWSGVKVFHIAAACLETSIDCEEQEAMRLIDA